MGLKMPTDEDILANKIFLNRASVRNKAKSWLSASASAELDQNSSSQSKPDQEAVDSDLSTIRAGDELSGVGVVSKVGNDDPTNRQLMSANEALRRKLLSKDAYKRYNESKKHGADMTRPTAKKREAEDDYEEEGKGKSIRQISVKPSGNDDGQEVDNTAGDHATTSKLSSKNKKRPSSYLDQLLADRKGKQQKKAKKSDSND